jgi:hypothetical protein
VENNEVIVSSRIQYRDFQHLNQIRLDRTNNNKQPTISELVREAITQFIGENT